MDNECLSGFEPLKTQLLGKCIIILFLLWKWIKYIFVLFVLTICIVNTNWLMNQLELLYSLHKEIGVGTPGTPFS